MAVLILAQTLCTAQYFAPNAGEQCVAVVPVLGKGTAADPLRPAYVPSQEELRNPKGITAFSWRLSDNKNFAIVQITARDRSAFIALQRDARNKVFVKGKDKRDVVEREMRGYLKDFSLDDMHGLKKGLLK